MKRTHLFFCLSLILCLAACSEPTQNTPITKEQATEGQKAGLDGAKPSPEQTLEQLRDISRKAPRKVQAHLDLARKYRKLKNTVMAAQEYHICIDIDPKAYDCLLEMGIMYRALRHWDLSIRALLRASALRPNDFRPQLELGDVYFYCHNRKEAMNAYETTLGLDGLKPKDADRARKRLAELKAGKFKGEVLPGQTKLPGQTP